MVIAALVACSPPAAAPRPSFVDKPVEVRPGHQAVAITPDSYAREASAHQPLILGAKTSGESVRWPLVATPAVVTAVLARRSVEVGPAIAPRRPRSTGAAAAIAEAAVTAALGLDPGSLGIAATGETSARDAAAIAAAALASARRLPLIEHTAVIGGLLPDGSLAGGPSVADVSAAAAAGVKKLGIPAGTRNAYDAGRKSRVDLVSRGAAAGVEVVEVVDLAAAFALMTGAELPQPTPVSSEEMEIEGEVDRRLEASYQSWRQRLAPAWSRVLERGEARLDETERRLVARLHRSVAAAEKEHAGGLGASALHRIRWAFAHARALSRMAGRVMPEPEREAERVALETSIAAALEAIRADGPGLRGEVLGRATRAWQLGRARDLAAAATASAFFENEAAATMWQATAAGAVELEGSWGDKTQLDAARARAIAAAHHHDAAQLGNATTPLEREGDRPADPLVDLARARRAHLDAWIAVARAELIGLDRHPKTGAVIAARDPKSLGRLLELADEAARRRARASLIAAGAVPVLARVHYQAARVLRGGDLAERLEALELYWESAWLSELAVLISRR